MKREIFHVDKHNIDDYAKSYGHWIVDGDVYEYIETCKLDPDSKWQTVIVQRESDRKYFMFEWGFAEGIYFYEPKISRTSTCFGFITANSGK